jgi:hypothetical protein
MQMAKTIRITVDDETHGEWKAEKGDRTWRDVLQDGINA